jgi:membrane-associated protease RseP (regulator of RpoE activity)
LRLPRHLVLLALTAYTMILNGAGIEAPGPAGNRFFDADLLDPSYLWLGAPYALALLAILGAHEMGHYVACRIYGVDATLPFFLPGPPFPAGFLGTFGAFIRIRSRFPDRNVLFDIGIAGPIAGLVVAVPVLAYGLLTARTAEIAGDMVRVDLPLLWRLISPLLPEVPSGHGRIISGPLMAGYIGCFATALNLLPIGQLDGGHVVYAVSARFHRAISILALAVLTCLGLLVFPGWLVFAALLVLVTPYHPPVLDPHPPLSLGRRLVSVAGLAMLALCFIPDPFGL